MPVVTESSSSSSTTIAEHIKLRRPRNQTTHHHLPPPTGDDSPPQIFPSSAQPSRFSKSAISSFFLLPSSSSYNETNPTKKKPQATSFRGLGCTAAASQQVSVPAVIRSSADWEAKKVKKKKRQNHSKKSSNSGGPMKVVSESMAINGGGCVAIPDVWCGPGIGFSTDAVVGGSVDPVVSGPRRNVQARRKIDGERMSSNHRESSFFPRRSINPESLSLLDSDSTLVTSRPEPALFSSRYHRHLRHPSPDGLAEQLLELGDKIGYVSTGLKEDEINCCLRRIKPSILINSPSYLTTTLKDKKCSICQEEYEKEEEMGKLSCGHSFHIQCIKQWLSHKNACPVCKIAAFPRP